MLMLALGLSVIMGLTMGLLGGGGTILTVPILLYVLGLPPREAIATSLVVVIATGTISLALHARAGNVQWRTGFMFGPLAMIGAFAGGYAAQFIPGKILLIIFTGLMITTATAMLYRGRRTTQARPPRSPVVRRGLIVIEGISVGLATGLVGAGGGFLIVPVLTLLAGLSMHHAVGTALVVIVMQSSASLVGYVSHAPIDFALAAMVAGMAILGSLVGTRLANRIPHQALRRIFAWFVLVMAGFILSRQLTPDVVHAVIDYPWRIALLAAVAAALVIVTVTFVLAGRRIEEPRVTPEP